MKYLVLILAIAACGDDGGEKPKPDSPIGPDIDAAMIDAPVTTPTFTSFTIDLILNQTTSTGAPKAFAEFSDLPDPDMNNPAAYSALF